MTTTDTAKLLAQLLPGYVPSPPPPPEPPPRLMPVAWPVLNRAAFYGLSGDVVRVIDPTTEADPVAVLVNFLLAFGNAVGRGPHLRIGQARHGTNEFALLIGNTAKARKGSSRDGVRSAMALADPAWSDRMANGLSSGEGLIWAVRDPAERMEPIKDRGRPTGDSELVVTDPGVADKRLFVEEEEFSTVLKQSERHGNTLSEVIRNVWDARERIQVLTKSNSTVATNAHISIIGHVTATEYRRRLTDTDQANGLANRFLLFCVTRSKVQAFLPPIDEGLLDTVSGELGDRLAHARRRGEVPFSPQGRELWETLYPIVSAPLLNLRGMMTARAETHALRLALNYALIDGDEAIQPAHLNAAVALIDYVRDSITWVFQDSLPNPLAERIAEVIATVGEIDSRGLHRALGGHYQANELREALHLLLEANRITHRSEPTGGRPRLIFGPVTS